MLNVLTVDEAIDIISKNFKPSFEVERVDLLNALGRCLAEDIYSQEPIPGFTRSTMDGFAVSSFDTFGASPSQPSYLQVMGDIKMGEVPDAVLNPGEAFKIATGGALPEGSDAVVMFEETEWLDDNTIGVLKPVAPGENVIFKGEDVKEGQRVCCKNSIVRPQDLGVLAGIGITEVFVFNRIKVGILSTGNEIVLPEIKELQPGKIRDINSYTIYGLVKEMNAEANIYGIVPDEFQMLKQVTEKALGENHIVVLSGGSSVGTKDLTARVLEELPDFKQLFHGISIKPGKPTLAAANGNKLIVGLPGHPVSAMVVFDVIIGPFLRVRSKTPKCTAVMASNVASSPGRQDYVRVRLVKENGFLKAEPILGKSGLISTMVESEGFVVIPLEKEGIAAGEEVEVELYGGR